MSYPLSDLLSATGLTPAKFMAKLGKDRAAFYYWRKRGLTFEQAEAWADTFGFVVYEIWPEWLAESNERAAALDAEDQAKRQARLAKKAARQRERYRTDPDFRQRKIESSRRYAAAGRVYIRHKNRIYNARNRDAILQRESERYYRNRESILQRKRQRYAESAES